MGRVVANASRRPLGRRTRREAVLEALTASGTAMETGYDMTYGSLSERFFYERALALGFRDFASDRWPTEEHRLSYAGSTFRDGATAIYETRDGLLILASLYEGWIRLRVASAEAKKLPGAFEAFRGLYPAAYLTQAADTRVPITFWANSNFGPQPRLRRIEAAGWDGIADNYTAEVRSQLADLMAWYDGPPADGQLILWQGPPGTGKSWGLRALASTWAPWAEFHYITDPDSFFVDDPSYMIEVLLADSYAVIEETTGDVYSEQRDGKWRVLILEDTGELLSANAKEKYGQGLSRLLNVVDGMIGQGLRVLALVTTNDELGDLHPAVVRPGRCASQIAFAPLTAEEAQAWTGDDEATSGTLAELYARYGRSPETALPAVEASGRRAGHARRALAMPESPVLPMTTFEAVSIFKAIRAVAEAHAPEGGYGETSWNSETRTVFWNHADWTSDDEHDAAQEAFLAIDGVDAFECESEANTPQGDGWEQVWPDAAAQAAIDHVIALASQPLPL